MVENQAKDKPLKKSEVSNESKFETPLADYAGAKSVLVNKKQLPSSIEPTALDFNTAPNIYAQSTVGEIGTNKPKDGKTTENTNQDSVGDFIPETLNPNLLKLLEGFNIPLETFQKALHEINQYGQDPESTIISLMKKNRILVFGENHSDPNPQRDFGAKIMPALREAGATHLAIEAPGTVQPALDEYMATGKLDPKAFPGVFGDSEKDYRKLLEAARAKGFKIVAVDDERIEGELSPNRDQDMAEGIKRILQDPKNKVVFWVGGGHLKYHSNRVESVADYLADAKFKAVTIEPIYPENRGKGCYPLAELTTDLKRPVILSTQQAVTVGNLHPDLTMLGQQEHMSDWNYILAYPNPPKSSVLPDQ